MSDLRTDLESLLAHPGWMWVVQSERSHWQGQMERYLKQASGERDEAMALNKLRQVLAAKDAVERVLNRPEEELRMLTAQHLKNSQPPNLSRRGPL
jgi:hypothetical protein